MEASQSKRKDYLEKIKDIAKEKLVCVDESGIEESINKDKGWRIKGKILEGNKSGKYYNRTNIIAGLVNNKPISPLVFKGSCNTELFNAWIKESLITQLKRGQVVIMGNAAFHRSTKTIELIQSVGCTLLLLPPYSPALNPIEKFWANMKRWLKDKIGQFARLYDALKHFFLIC